jgi:hypothetical protein
MASSPGVLRFKCSLSTHIADQMRSGTRSAPYSRIVAN